MTRNPAALLLGLVLVVGCGGTGHPRSKVLMLGLDGLDPLTIDLLMSEDKLPNFARLRSNGAYGKLRATPPLLSPVLWTTMATGKRPTEHGIGHFVAVDTAGAALPVTSTMRRVKAVWNIASDAGRTVATVGYWATWPPENVNGAVVSDHTCYHFLFREEASGGAGPAVTSPPELADRLAPLIRRPADITYDEASRYIDVSPHELDHAFDFADETSHFRWALATTDSYAAIGLDLWRQLDPDLLMVYLEGIDSTSHLFGHLFRTEGLAGELAEQQRRFGRAAEEMYVHADEILGRFLAVMDSRTTLIVVSDHGFTLGELPDDPSTTRDLRRVSARDHRELGILYMYGANVRTHGRVDAPDQLDITPTILTLLGLEPARDMPGRVLSEALTSPAEARERTVSTYETGGPGAATAHEMTEADAQILAHLRSLGYLDEGMTSPTGDRNLAAMEFEAGNYAEAAEIYRRLIGDSPEDPSLYTSLAGCLGAERRYDEALAALGKGLALDPLNIEAYHNRAVIHERRGEVAAAIEDYRTALRYAPNYQPSRTALIRLTGSAAVRAPRSERERTAVHLAEEASISARRGAYDEARRLLDKAAAVAPDSVVVFQYRANVAFLAGDLDGAEEALVRALELEPGNALFERNLANVRSTRASRGR